MSAKTTSNSSWTSLVLMKSYLRRNPRFCFGAMIASLVLSLGLSLFWNGGDPIERHGLSAPVRTVQQNYDQVLGHVQSLSGILQLQQEVNLLMSQAELSHNDSLRLLGLCQQLEQLNKQLIPIQK